MVAPASLLRAQSPPASDSSDLWKVWASLSLGPGAVNGDARLAGNFALWVTRDRLAIWVRDAGASRFLDPGDTGDISILSGIHPRTVSHVDFVAGVGLGWSLGHDDAGRELQRTPVLALGTQLNVNYRVIGLVLDGFAAAGNSRSYYGVCLGVGVGWFR